MKKKVYIRADGNEIIATGHIMRCLSIAEQLRKNDVDVTFITADNSACDIIKEREFTVDILNSVWNDLDNEIESICDYLVKNKVKVLIVDSYYVTQKYLEKLSEYAKVIYIDDLKKFEYNVKAVICDNPFAVISDYEKMYKNIECPDLLVGGKYAPLRDEFAYKEYIVNDEIKRILITTGGTDIYNITGKLINALEKYDEFKKIEIHTIVGRFNQNQKKLSELEKRYSNVILHRNVRNISYWMRLCDIAVSAGGTTLYELCSCGIPTVCLAIADNQNETYMWNKKEYMLYAGNASEGVEKCIEKCIGCIEEYSNNYELRSRLSRRMQMLIDGLGTARIAEYIQKL